MHHWQVDNDINDIPHAHCTATLEICCKSFARLDFDFERLVTTKLSRVQPSPRRNTTVCMKSEVPPEPSQESASLLKRLAGPSSTKAGSVPRIQH